LLVKGGKKSSVPGIIDKQSNIVIPKSYRLVVEWLYITMKTLSDR
jgi:hypothetical protein